jgi:thioredoxin-like negative regulator of GroEL
MGLVLLIKYLSLENGDRLRMQAESASRAGDWGKALGLWRRINAGSGATGATHLGEGRASLALGLAAQAERALRKAAVAAPGEPEAWLLLLKIFRVEDRPLEAFQLGWEAFSALPPENRTELLRELTLTALTDLPDNLARETLRRWIESDPGDIDARVAYLRRIGAEPRSDDPDQATRLAELSDLLASHPDHVGAREALVTALADAGEPERGQTLLESWPAGQRDGRYWRLQGRLTLEHAHQPGPAASALRTALVDFPQDWRTHYRLARALQMEKRTAEAQQEAEVVGRIRELLDPSMLGARLDVSFLHLDDPAALATLAALCDRAGLTRLAQAWRDSKPASAEPDSSSPPMFPQGNAPGGRATWPWLSSPDSHSNHPPLVSNEERPVVLAVYRALGRSSRCWA